MFSFLGRPYRLCDGISRRELLRIGGLGTLGLSLPGLLAGREVAPLGVPPTDKTFGRAKNVIFLYLAGGPPQHETFDPKPDAPREVRGPFDPISTNVPGIQYCELLPRTAGLADKLAVIRSLATDDNTHSSSGYWVLTGYKYQGPNPRTIQPTDWPYFGSLVKRYRPSEVLPPLSTVWIPDIMRLNENVTPAGQTGGFMGSQWDPDRFVGDPSQRDYEVEGLRLGDLPVDQLKRRQQLLSDLQRGFDVRQRGRQGVLYEQFQQQAFDLLTSGRARQAFAIDQEAPRVRERYGNNRWGQCVLLARRLIEAGVRLVHVQWPREPGDNAVDNPLWDTHAQNADRLEDVLCPQFDVAYSALIEDLDQRGLLDETLVVAVGEFGRTPKINAKGGRDHWGAVFSCALAGAGIAGGQTYGSSDKQGGHPVEDRVRPGDLTATMFHLLGMNYQSTFTDLEGREHRFTEGKPLFKLLGLKPATEQRRVSEGDVTRVPPFDPTLTLVQTDFRGPAPVRPISFPSRPKGWRCDPLLPADQPGLGVRVEDDTAWVGLLPALAPQSPQSTQPTHSPGPAGATIAANATALLAQEVRSPFAGTYRLRFKVQGFAPSAAEFERVFDREFQVHLLFLEFADTQKNARQSKELGRQRIHPRFQPDPQGDWQTVEFSKEFVNPQPGSNFSFGPGLGIALLVSRSPAPPQSPAAQAPAAQAPAPQAPAAQAPAAQSPAPEAAGALVYDGRARIGLRIQAAELEFVGKQRNAKVKV